MFLSSIFNVFLPKRVCLARFSAAINSLNSCCLFNPLTFSQPYYPNEEPERKTTEEAFMDLLGYFSSTCTINTSL